MLGSQNARKQVHLTKKKFSRSQTSYRQDKGKQASDLSHKRNPPHHHINNATDLMGLSLRQNNIKMKHSQMTTVSLRLLRRY